MTIQSKRSQSADMYDWAIWRVSCLENCWSLPSDGKYCRSRSKASFKLCILLRSLALAANLRFFLTTGGICFSLRCFLVDPCLVSLMAWDVSRVEVVQSDIELFSESLANSRLREKFLLPMLSVWISRFVGKYFGVDNETNSGLDDRRLFGVCQPSDNVIRISGFE